jgi:hypothetical protein
LADLTAVDILILPDDTMLEHAKAWNARLLKSVPSGFALDENHTPHITLLQRYVHTDQLDDVFDAVGSSIADLPASSLELNALKLAHMELAALPGIGLTGLVCKAGPAVIDLQSVLIDAIAPHTGSGGTSEAFVTSEAEPDINEDTRTYVENYVPDHSGTNFMAHVTVGQGTLDDLAHFEADQFDGFEFHPAGFAIYHLGNNGTAQTRLHHWDLS